MIWCERAWRTAMANPAIFSSIDRRFLRCAAAALLAGAVVVAGTGQAGAADLNSGAYAPRAGSPYDDPRYAELYGPNHATRYERRREHYRPRHRSYKDSEPLYLDQHGRRVAPNENGHKYGYNERPADPRYDRHRDRRYDRNHRPSRLAAHCLPRPVVMRRLQRDGWRAFSRHRVSWSASPRHRRQR